MTDVDLKNALLAGDPDKRTDGIEEVKTHAGVVVVRPLTRGEVLDLQSQKGREKLTIAEFEQRLVSIGMVSPKMTPSEVEKWQAVDLARGALTDVTDKISEISGLTEGASKSRVPGTR